MKSKIYMSEIDSINDCPFMGMNTVVCENWGKDIPEATHICSCESTRRDKFSLPIVGV